MSLPANGGQTLTVVEERELRQTTQVNSLTPDALVRDRKSTRLNSSHV